MARKSNGFSVLSIVICLTILSIAFIAYTRVATFSKKTLIELRQKSLAQAQATELLEVFRSMTSADLRSYLDCHPGCFPVCAPACRAAQPPPYSLCAHVNLLNRTNSQILNIDPKVDLSSSSLDRGSALSKRANRYYQVQIVDITNMQFKNVGGVAVCDTNFNLTGNERFFVTVGVTWLPTGKTGENPQRVLLSTLIPN